MHNLIASVVASLVAIKVPTTSVLYTLGCINAYGVVFLAILYGAVALLGLGAVLCHRHREALGFTFLLTGIGVLYTTLGVLVYAHVNHLV